MASLLRSLRTTSTGPCVASASCAVASSSTAASGSSRALSTSAARPASNYHVNAFAPFTNMARPPRHDARRGAPGAPGNGLRPMNKGDIYTPAELKWPNRHDESIYRRPKAILGPSAVEARAIDPFHRLKIHPMNEYRNGRLLSAFLSETGRIKSRAETGLTRNRQRQVGLAVKRAQRMGLLSRWGNIDPFDPARARKVEAATSHQPTPTLSTFFAAAGSPGGLAVGNSNAQPGFRSARPNPFAPGGRAAVGAIQAPVVGQRQSKPEGGFPPVVGGFGRI